MRPTRLLPLLLVLLPVVALWPFGRAVWDWVEMTQAFGAIEAPTSSGRAYDWVVWSDAEGPITARYVFPGGPGDRAGIRAGDVFYEFDGLQVFTAEDLRRACAGVPVGEARTYALLRGDESVVASVRMARYPTFVYPLGAGLWRFALWGFLVGAFVHLLGLIIAAPLARRSMKSAVALGLVSVSALWIVGHLARLVALEFAGPPAEPGGLYDGAMRALTLASIVGWIGFPGLLLQKVAADAHRMGVGGLRWPRRLAALPPMLLGSLALVAGIRGGIGPLSVDALAVPILFYVACYIAAAGLVVLVLFGHAADEARTRLGGWGRIGAALVAVVAATGALSVLGIVPILETVGDATAGWLLVAAQLLSVVPVILVSLTTIRHGRVDLVVTRAFTYLAVYGLLFFAVVAGFVLLDPLIERTELSRSVVVGAYVVALLILFERAGRRLRGYVEHVFQSERQRARLSVSRLQVELRDILSEDRLARRTIDTVGEALDARSAVIYLRRPGTADEWVSASFHPEPPYLTERMLRMLWPYLQEDQRVWARNPELNESRLPTDVASILGAARAALAIPVAGPARVQGVIVLGRRRARRAVYNLEDVELLRALGVQLAVTLDRLELVEREKTLVRESSEAQLVALRAQINPHFLFNALNTIAALIDEKPEVAEATVEHLAAIFRHTLNTGSRAYVTLAEELRLVEHYLAIESSRFGDRLQVDVDLPAELRDVPVPAFAIQTLVENAVKHGLERQREGGRLHIAAEPADAGAVAVVVADTGVGIPTLFDAPDGASGAQAFFGIGLNNVAARMEQLYGRADLLHVSSRPDDGTRVRLLLPASVPPTLGLGDGSSHAPSASSPLSSDADR